MRIFLPCSSSVRRALPVLALLSLAAPLAQAAHPLATDDTGVQGAGNWQLELNTDHTRTREAAGTVWARQLNTTLTRGVTDDLDVGVNVPLLRQGALDGSTESGVGDVTLQAKWRLYDNGQGWSLGARPSITLPTGSRRDGLGNGRAGAGVASLSQLEAGDWTWLVNAAYVYNANRVSARKHLWTASTALTYQASKAWTLVSEVGVTRPADMIGPRTTRFGLIGAVYHLNDKTDLDLGWRRSWGTSQQVNTWGAGLTVRW